jgi:hypothetical protein
MAPAHSTFEAYREVIDARDAANRYDHATAVAHYLQLFTPPAEAST